MPTSALPFAQIELQQHFSDQTASDQICIFLCRACQLRNNSFHQTRRRCPKQDTHQRARPDAPLHLCKSCFFEKLFSSDGQLHVFIAREVFDDKLLAIVRHGMQSQTFLCWAFVYFTPSNTAVLTTMEARHPTRIRHARKRPR